MALYDGEAEISAAQISALLAATNNKVAAYWPSLFAGFLKGRIETLIFSGGAGAGSAPAAAAAAAPAAAGGAAPAEKKEKPKVEEVDALEGGMDMFGGGGGGGDY
jgi:large subunit ribosomal protein LP1